jgi:small neutral amino acid transporter SnatA (MarC family)
MTALFLSTLVSLFSLINPQSTMPVFISLSMALLMLRIKIYLVCFTNFNFFLSGVFGIKHYLW